MIRNPSLLDQGAPLLPYLQIGLDNSSSYFLDYIIPSFPIADGSVLATPPLIILSNQQCSHVGQTKEMVTEIYNQIYAFFEEKRY